MLQKAIDYIHSLLRPELLDDKYGNHYIYDGNDRIYRRIKKQEPQTRHLCNIESFAQIVLESLKLMSPSLPRTVIFESYGANFYTNEELREEQDIWKFERKYTNLWYCVESLCKGYETQFKHKELLDKLESIKSYVLDFENLYQTLSKLRASKRISFASSPIFTDGEQSGGYEWEQKIDSNGSTEKAHCPSKIRFKGKIVRGSSADYEFEINLVPVIDEEQGRIYFKCYMPTIDLVLDQVREDEYNDFIKLLGEESKKLLILRNY